MRRSRLGELLLAAGAVVGAAAVVGLVVGFDPATLPPALLKLTFYKLTFIGAAGLFVAGGLAYRYARRDEQRLPQVDAAEVDPHQPAALADGLANPPASDPRDDRSPLPLHEDRRG